MKIGVIGLGYVGLSTACVLAEFGNNLVGVDIDQRKVDLLNSGKSPIFEYGIEHLLLSNLELERIVFSTNYRELTDCQVIFIAVPTPAKPSGEADVSYLEEAARSLAKVLTACADPRTELVVNKSTVPIGSWNLVGSILQRMGVNHNIYVASNPEFLREGSAIFDTFYPDRIVVGSDNEKATALLRTIYRPVIEQDFVPPSWLPRPEGKTKVPFVVVNPVSAEVIKYAANAFLATKISFINEIGNICELVGADVSSVALGIGLDHRIGTEFLNAGIGYGGSCFSKDISALISTAQEYNYVPELLIATEAVNKKQHLVVIRKLQETLKVIRGRTIGLLGLSFKAGTDDLRDAPSLKLIRELKRLGGIVKAYDPIAEENFKTSYPEMEVELCDNALDCAAGANALVIVTDWPEFKTLPLKEIKNKMISPVIIDGRNILSRSFAESYGFIYRGIGR